MKKGLTVAGVTTLLTALGWVRVDEAEPVVQSVNEGQELLSDWESESPYADPSLPPECVFLNGTVQYSDTLCSHFVLSRSSSLPALAVQRARRCAAHYDVECVLSPEVGLQSPVAFVFAATNDVTAIVGPRLLPTPSETKRVRIVHPINSLLSRSMLLNRTIQVEYLDGITRTPKTMTFNAPESYCVQLLRHAFEPGCWEKLD